MREAEKVWGKFGIQEVIGAMRKHELIVSVIKNSIFREKGIGILRAFGVLL